ncbi:MAG: outer membrane protein assembly factor BamD [Planctomycetota bacterium]
MTGKSPPRTQYRYPYCVLTLVLLATSVSGCSVFSPYKDAYSDYEDAKSKLEDPAGVYRPEGVSAEADYFAEGFLDRIGIRAKKRRDIQVARSQYQRADQLFEQAKAAQGPDRRDGFRAAADEYRRAASNWQSSGLEQDALLMAAEAHFFAEDYYRAEGLYADLVKEYPKNPYIDHVDSRRFEIADYWLQYDKSNPSPFVVVNFSDNKRPWNDTRGHGKRVLETVRLENPTGKIGDDATMRLAMEDYERGDFEAAADTFADLRLTYPDSEHQFNAQLLELKSLLASYQGPQYSSIPIRDAMKRIEQLRKQFPQKVQEHQQEVQEAYAQARYSMAERIWTQAKFRRRKGENGAARFHYERILNDFADTPFANQAGEQLAAIKDSPAVPPQRFKALVWLMGGTTDDKPWRDKVQGAAPN